MNILTQDYDEAQYRLPPALPDDLAVWIGARVKYIHIHGFWPGIQTGTVLEAKYDRQGRRWLLIKPDDSRRLTVWRACPHDILIVE